MKRNLKTNFLWGSLLLAITLVGVIFVKGIQPIHAMEEPYQLSLVDTDTGKALQIKVDDTDEQYTLELKGMNVEANFAAEKGVSDVSESETKNATEDSKKEIDFSSFEVKSKGVSEMITFTFSGETMEYLIPVESEDFSEATATLNSGEKEVAIWNEKSETDISSNEDTVENDSSTATTETTVDSIEVSPIGESTIESALSGEAEMTYHSKASSFVTKAAANGYVPSTPEEQAAANQAADTKHQFDPEVNAVTASTWAEFYAAYNDQTITKITLTADITDPGGTGSRLTARQKSIEINGQGFLLYLAYGHSLRTNNSPNSFTENGRSRSAFHMHDIVVTQGTIAGNANGWLGVPEGEGSWSFVGGDGAVTNMGQNWYYRFGNIKTIDNPANRRGVARLARAYQGEITMYGYNEVTTFAENFYAGSVVVEDGTYWINSNVYYNYSTLWYVTASDAGDTGETKEYTVGKNSFVYSRNTGSGTAFPAIYQHYGTMTIGENSTFNANMQGNAVRFDDSGSEFVLKAGATTNLLSRGGGAVVLYNASNTSFVTEPTSSVFIVGQSTAGIISLGTLLTNNKFLIDSPKAFDIRNRNTATTTNSRVLTTSTSATKTFEIIYSDIDLWKNTSAVMGPSDYSYAQVDTTKFTGQTATSSNSELQSTLSTLSYNGFRRITGMNSTPETTWLPVTDADKSYGVEVIIGYTPDDNFDENGNAVLIPVYAAKDQVEVKFVDTYGVEHTAKTDENGKAEFTDTVFNQAEKDISALATRGPWVQDKEDITTVIDVTPPEPMKVTAGKLTNADKVLTAKDMEPNAKVTLSINGGTLIDAGTIASDGTWTYDLTQYLEAGDKVKIYLEDTSTLPDGFDQKGLENTRTATGNRNPEKDTYYHDAIFKAATEYVVEDVLSNSATIEKTVAVEGGATTTQVGDWLIYTLTVKNTKDASLDTVWKDVKIEDVLDANLKFDAANTGITPSDATFDYDETSRKLTLNLGDLASQEEKTVTFKAQVQRSAVGNTILNSAKAIGYTPREAGTFVPGIVANPTYETYEVETDKPVENPGGAVFGTLSLLSAPNVIDFDIQSINEKATHVTKPAYSNPLVIEDTRADDRQDPWHITVKLTQELTLVNDDGSLGNEVLRDAIRFVHGDEKTTLSTQALPLVGSDYVSPDANGLYNLSDGWKDTTSTDGFELYVPAGKVESVGNYQAVLEWNIENTPLPATANTLPKD